MAQEARALIDRLVGERDAVTGGRGARRLGRSTTSTIGAVVDACTTPPFLVDRRVVVVREAGRLTAADAERLVEMLADPAALDRPGAGGRRGDGAPGPGEGGASAGGVVDASAGRTARDRERVAGRPAAGGAGAPRPRGPPSGSAPTWARTSGGSSGILQTLAAAYGAGRHHRRGPAGAFLGEAGSVPPWDLTDAVDRGDMAGALATLRRMTGAGGRAAPVIVCHLHRHFSRMLQLDGADVTSGAGRRPLLGERSAFVAKKALAQGNRLGSERVAQAIGWLATADLDVKGRSALPTDVVLEILVARLCRLSRTPGAGPPALTASPRGR